MPFNRLQSLKFIAATLTLAILFRVFRPYLTPAIRQTIASRKHSTATTTPVDMTNPRLRFQHLPSSERGHADHGWLKTYHTFSFASYYDPEFEQFGPLRVINEDRVAIGKGFGAHSHREFEIWSYILSGELRHQDSMGNTEVLKRGDVQYTTAGTGITHAEYQHGDKEEVHFLQIWALPAEKKMKPKYFTRSWTDEMKRDTLAAVVLPDESSVANATEVRGVEGKAMPIRQDLGMWASIVSPGKKVKHVFARDMGEAAGKKERAVYIHFPMRSGYRAPGENYGDKVGKLKVNGGSSELKEGDGCFVRKGVPGETLEIENVGGKAAEFVLFDLNV